MDSKLRNQIDEIFIEVLGLPPETQKDLLDQRCNGLPDIVREEVIRLLAADMEASAAGFSRADLLATTEGHNPDEPLGTIGRYRLLQQIGEGGMGVVYMAAQTEPVNRFVALKVVKPGITTRDVLARFDAERQALSMMDHPNIAKVLDAGETEAGQPYFVMELVKGVPITAYCDHNRLDTTRRLALFISVCQAVAHAHQKGIIHRDIKPSNVLVAEYDDDPVPKIIDFGIAKATSQKLTDKTLFTKFGQLIGTFEYMSPEQAKLNQLDVDTRSDIYSLGVLLYELLTGTTPFGRERFRSAAIDEIIRIICEEDPPRPSTVLTTRTVSGVAKRRNAHPERLAKLVRGELDWIVMRSLEKERQRRYQTVGSLADDLRRYIDGETVEACPPTLAYRTRKFVRKYLPQLVATAVVVGFLCATSLLGWNLFRVTQQKYVEELTLRQVAESNVAANAPVQSTRHAIQAIESSLDNRGTPSPAAVEALWRSVSTLGGEPLAAHARPVRSIALSSDARWLVSTSNDPDGPLLQNLESRTVLRLPHPNAYRAAVSPNQHWIATAGDSRLMLWQLKGEETPDNGRTLYERQPDAPVYQSGFVGFSQDSRWLVATFYNGIVRVCDLSDDDGQPTVRDLRGHEDSEVIKASINNDGSRLVTSSVDGKVLVWNLITGEDKPIHELHHDTVDRVTVSPDGRWLVTAHDSAVLWDLAAPDPVKSKTLLKDQEGAYCVMITKDSERLIIGGLDGSCCLYDLTAPHPIETCLELNGHPCPVSSVAIRDDDYQLLITGGMHDQMIRFWHLDQVPTRELTTTIDKDGIKARLWDVGTNSQGTFTMSGHDSSIRLMCISSDHKMLVTGGWNGFVRLWRLDLANPSGGYTIDRPGVVQKTAVTPDGKWLVVGRNGPNSRLWRLPEDGGALTQAIKLEGAEDGIGEFVVDRDSRWLVGTSSVRNKDGNYARNEDVAHVWDLTASEPGRIAYRLEGHSGAVTALAMPSPNTVITGGEDRTLRVWEMGDDKPECLREIKDHESAVSCIASNDDASVIVCGCRSGPVSVWTLNSDDHSGNLKQTSMTLH